MPSQPSIEVNHELHLETHGWTLLPQVFQGESLQDLRGLTARLAISRDDAVRSKSGEVYAARNLLQLCPEMSQLWRNSRLVELVLRVCGKQAGLARGLFFDKPPEQTWALPWHKDLLIAVNGPSHFAGYSRPRLRAGVWHTEPPLEVLQSMLTLRIHLDAMTTLNGPLHVRSGSHVTGKQLSLAQFPDEQILGAAGDVLAMRPLLAHASNRSHPECTDHRRIVHLEFGSLSRLPGGAEWHQFEPVVAQQ